MIIDFRRVEEVLIPNFRGGEKILACKAFDDGQNRILYARLEAGGSIGLHTHDTSSETIYILEGSGYYLIDGKKEPVSAGLCHYCPKGSSHTLINDGEQELVFFAVIPQQ